jgi:selenocysteine lyase/cysteine desulfurase
MFSRKFAEIAVSPKTTQAFKVISAVPHGTSVKAGDLLVEFDAESFQEQLAAAERELQAAEVAAKESQREMELLLEQHPIDVEQDSIDLLCFSCHKSLYSIQGLGAIYIKEGINLKPLRFGGTGSKSESIDQPAVLPDKYESGTPNTPAIASLYGGLTFIENTGFTKIIEKKKILRDNITKGLSTIKGVDLYGPSQTAHDPLLPVVSFNIKNLLPSEIGYLLNKEQIYTRVGLHCSPVAHKTIGTYSQGTVRAAPGYFTTNEDIERFLEVIKQIAKK